jgi:pimeloyl-ACP methyl ester carboxylesterase
LSSRDDFAAYRRSLPRPPRLARHTVRARGLDFAVFTTPPVADATPLVCINGGLLFDHRLLWPALSPLAEGRQVVLYDQRGRGASQAPPGPRAARIEHDAGDVGAIREALGIPRWDVLGHSWGGGIAMLAAAADPAGTRRLVLVNAVGATSEGWLDELHERALERLDDPGRAALERADDALAAHLAAGGEPGDPALLSDYQAAIYPAWFADRELAPLFNPPRSTSRTGAAVSARLRHTGYDWRETLRGVVAPTLVIHGEGDLLPPAIARTTAALLGAELALIPGAGHMPFWETPARFFALVEEFLRR